MLAGHHHLPRRLPAGERERERARDGTCQGIIHGKFMSFVFVFFGVHSFQLFVFVFPNNSFPLPF